MALGLWKKIKQGVSNAWNKTKNWVKNGGVGRLINGAGNIIQGAGRALGLVREGAQAAGVDVENNRLLNGAQNFVNGAQNVLTNVNNAANKLNLLA